MSGNEWQRRLHRPISIGCVEIRVADSRSMDPDLHLTPAWFWNGDFLDYEWLAEFVYNCCFHH
jgi:hypothetical protein